jgi:amidase
MGSVIRPAAFCGIVGFKPSHGLVSVDGMKESALVCDTVGFLVRTVEDLPLLMAVLARSQAGAWDMQLNRPPRIGIMFGPGGQHVLSETREAIESTIRIMTSGGASTIAIAPPAELESMLEAAWTALRYENSQHWAFEHRARRSGLSTRLAEFLDESLAVTAADYATALRNADVGRQVLSNLFRSVDVILTPAAPGEAPKGLLSTGDAIFSRAWTLAHVPCLTVPAGKGPKGLPIGIQLIGPHFADAQLIAVGRWLEPRLSWQSE